MAPGQNFPWFALSPMIEVEEARVAEEVCILTHIFIHELICHVGGCQVRVSDTYHISTYMNIYLRTIPAFSKSNFRGAAREIVAMQAICMSHVCAYATYWSLPHMMGLPCGTT